MTPPDPRAMLDPRPCASVNDAGLRLRAPSDCSSALSWIALATLPIAAIAVGLVRITCGDIAWHLATARAAQALGHWPITNHFSHTWAGYTLYQQYPAFQTVLYFIQERFGFEGLSVLLCGLWAAVLLLFMRWGGSWNRTAQCGLAWMLALLCIQRRIMLRPEAVSLTALAFSLLVIDRYLRGRRWWILLLPVIQLAWVNSHQMYPLGWLLHGMLLAHIILARFGRWNVSRVDRYVALTPVGLSLIACVAVTACTPLGWDLFAALSRTSGSLSAHREHIRELAPIWTKPIEATLAIPCLFLGLAAIVRQRRAWRPLDVGLWLVTLAMTISANRGLVFFALVSVGLFARSQPGHALFPALLRWRPMTAAGGAIATLILAGVVIHQRWIAPPIVLGGTQPGVGRSIGDWPSSATAFLAQSPPPGKMLNLPWSLGNSVIWDLPMIPTFVDPRFESYPRCFMLDCIASVHSDDVLSRLLRDHDIQWVYADHRSPGVLHRLPALCAGGEWRLVHADSQTAVLIHDCMKTRDYLASLGPRKWSADTCDPADLVAAPNGLRIRQRLAYARFLAAFHHDQQAVSQYETARAESHDDRALLALVARNLADTRVEFAWNGRTVTATAALDRSVGP